MYSAPASPATISPAQPVPVEYDLLCEGCGYSLLGLYSDRCPECGRPFDPTELPLARVPWLYRARLGRVRAYLATVWMVLRRPREFAAEMCRPVRVSPDDARGFRRATLRLVLMTYVIGAAAIMVIAIREMLRVGVLTQTLYWIMPLIALTLGALALMAFLAMATDLPTFIWRGLPTSPDDLGPLHHYACAPLALVPPLAILAGGAIGAGYVLGWAPPNGEPAPESVVFVAALAALLASLVWWIPPILMRAATRCGPRRMFALAAYLPLHWVLMFAFAFGFWSAAMFYGAEWAEGAW
jgi:hypothetical protein